jgi:hypothetical protein
MAAYIIHLDLHNKIHMLLIYYEALYMCQTLIRSLNTFTFTCAVRYFKPLIIIQVTELTLLWYDLCLMWYRILTKKIQPSLLMHIKVWHCIGVKP